MGLFFSLFTCDSEGGNRGYEDRFQWFVVSRDDEKGLRCVQRDQLKRLLDCVREPSNHTAVASLAKLLGVSLERGTYDLFIEEIGLAAAAIIFFEGSIENSEGFPDFEKTKDFNYRKYCLFKFASFLELLRPGSVRWRGQAQLETVPLVTGLARFLNADLDSRTLMLSRWIRQGRLSAFLESARQSQKNKRLEFLHTLENLRAGDIAQALDAAGFRPRKYPSYMEWFRTNRKTFEPWLSKQRAEN